jgi:branched-chain amino acid transport system substrate-binding protein
LHKRSLLWGVSVFVAVGLVAGACSKSSNTGTTGGSKNVKIGFFGALTGGASALVVPGYQAVQLAFEQANSGKFGNLPVKIQVVGEDTQGSPTVIPPLATKVANDQSFVGVIGPNFSGESKAAGPIFDGAGIPFVTNSATNPGLAENGWTHWFRAQGNDNSQGPALAHYITKVIKPNCAYVTSDDSTYGKGLADIAGKTITADGLKETSELGAVTTGQKDFSALITKVKSSKCTVLFYGGYTPEAAPLRQQMVSGGLKSVTLVGGDGIQDADFVKNSGAAGEGTVASCPCGPISAISSNPGVSDFVAAYKAKWNQDPGIYSADAYDVARMYIEAFKTGATTRQAITDWFAKADYKGLSKEISFTSNHELNPAAVRIYLYKDESQAWAFLGEAKDVGAV